MAKWRGEEKNSNEQSKQRESMAHIHWLHECFAIAIFFLHFILTFFLACLWVFLFNEIRLQFMIYLLCYYSSCAAIAKPFAFVVVLVSSISRSQVINWKLYGKTDWLWNPMKRCSAQEIEAILWGRICRGYYAIEQNEYRIPPDEKVKVLHGENNSHNK